MALVRQFERRSLERNSLHKEIGATYSIFERDGRKLLQINTFGTEDREIPGKVSQTIQLDAEGAYALFHILRREFGFEDGAAVSK